MSELAPESGMQVPATRKLVDRMMDAAPLQRSMDPVDHRRVILHISDFGFEKVNALAGDIQRRRDRLGLSPTRADAGDASRSRPGRHGLP